MPTITLIQPLFTNKHMDRNVKTIYPLGLGYLAAYIPDTWKIKVVDEQIEKIDFDIKTDVVGITTTTATINRAYEVAEEFKKRNVTTVLGGVHVSMCPDEAEPYCDAICIGDGEEAIVEILSDWEKGELKKVYHGSLKPLKDLKPPRRDLFKTGYTFIPVSTSRGCPFNCNFCAIHKFYQGKYRTREVEEVVEELKQLPKGHNTVFFSDGNMYGYTEKDIFRFKELCKRIAEERKKGTLNFKYFMGYGSVNALDDIEALDLASKAGCIMLFVGFESINPGSLKDMGKKLNLKYGPESYYRLVENAQKRKIMVVGEMIVGTDSDNIEVLKKTSDFLNKINFNILRLQIMQPLPGTKLFKTLQQEDRLLLSNFPDDWIKGTKEFIMGVHFELKQMKPLELKKWVKNAGMDFYKPTKILMRSFKYFQLTKSPKFTLMMIVLNFKSRKTYANYKIKE